MGGHMVSVQKDSDNLFYMVNVENQAEAIAQVERMSGLGNGQALAPLEPATLDHYGVEIGQVRQFLTLDHEGAVAYSAD